MKGLKRKFDKNFYGLFWQRNSVKIVDEIEGKLNFVKNIHQSSLHLDVCSV